MYNRRGRWRSRSVLRTGDWSHPTAPTLSPTPHYRLFGGFELEGGLGGGVVVAELPEDVSELAVDFLRGHAEEIELEVT